MAGIKASTGCSRNGVTIVLYRKDVPAIQEILAVPAEVLESNRAGASARSGHRGFPPIMSSLPNPHRISRIRTICQAGVTSLSLAVFSCTFMAYGQDAKTAPNTSNGASSSADNDRASAYYHYMLAHEYEDMANTYGRPEYATRAIEEYKLALNADPDSKYLNNGLAELYFRTGHVRDAIVAAQEQIKKDPNNLEAHKLLGSIYLRSLGDGQQNG